LLGGEQGMTNRLRRREVRNGDRQTCRHKNQASKGSRCMESRLKRSQNAVGDRSREPWSPPPPEEHTESLHSPSREKDGEKGKDSVWPEPDPGYHRQIALGSGASAGGEDTQEAAHHQRGRKERRGKACPSRDRPGKTIHQRF